MRCDLHPMSLSFKVTVHRRRLISFVTISIYLRSVAAFCFLTGVSPQAGSPPEQADDHQDEGYNGPLRCIGFSQRPEERSKRESGRLSVCVWICDDCMLTESGIACGSLAPPFRSVRGIVSDHDLSQVDCIASKGQATITSCLKACGGYHKHLLTESKHHRVFLKLQPSHQHP